MAAVIAFEPRRFESAAPYYLEGRPAYAPRLIARVSNLLGLNAAQRLLDLGTGPGLLAVAFAHYIADITAIDPEPEMLRFAAQHASNSGVLLHLLEGSSYTLDESLGAFDLVTIGRAFHWMDRTATLQTLDKIIRPGGALALFSTRHPALPENGWSKEYDALRETHGEPNSHRFIRRSPDWVPHEKILLDSAFPVLERISVIERRSTPLEDFIARGLSLSSSSPGRIGTSAAEFAVELRRVLLKYAVDGVIEEIVESEALLAFREPR